MDTAKQLRLYTDLDETSRGSLWIELLHMERHGFDIARQKGVLSSYIRDVYDDASSIAISDDEEREAALALRRRLRSELGLPPLSPEAEASWRYEMPDWSFYPDLHGPDRAQLEGLIAPITEWIRENDPELVRYVAKVDRHNAPLGYNGGPNDKDIIRGRWAWGAIVGASAQVPGEQTPANISKVSRDIWKSLSGGEM